MAYNKLKGRIIEKFGSIGAFVEELGITRQNFNHKIHNKNGLSQKDMVAWATVLNISTEEFGYFFYQ